MPGADFYPCGLILNGDSCDFPIGCSQTCHDFPRSRMVLNASDYSQRQSSWTRSSWTRKYWIASSVGKPLKLIHRFVCLNLAQELTVPSPMDWLGLPPFVALLRQRVHCRVSQPVLSANGPVLNRNDSGPRHHHFLTGMHSWARLHVSSWFYQYLTPVFLVTRRLDRVRSVQPDQSVNGPAWNPTGNVQPYCHAGNEFPALLHGFPHLKLQPFLRV